MTEWRRETEGSPRQTRLADSRPIVFSSSFRAKVVPFKGPAMAASLGVILGRVLFNTFASTKDRANAVSWKRGDASGDSCILKSQRLSEIKEIAVELASVHLRKSKRGDQRLCTVHLAAEL